MLVAAGSCPHMDLWRGDNSAESPEPLVTWWNEWAAAEAAKRCAARGMSLEDAARWLDSLRPHQYAPAIVRR